MTEFDVWLLMMLDPFRNFMLVTSIISIVFFLFMGLYQAIEKDEYKFLLIHKKKLTLVLFWILLSNIIPSTKQAVAIILIPKIINNEKVQEIPVKLLNIVDKKLTSLLSEEVIEKKIKSTIKIK